MQDYLYHIITPIETIFNRLEEFCFYMSEKDGFDLQHQLKIFSDKVIWKTDLNKELDKDAYDKLYAQINYDFHQMSIVTSENKSVYNTFKYGDHILDYKFIISKLPKIRPCLYLYLRYTYSPNHNMIYRRDWRKYKIIEYGLSTVYSNAHMNEITENMRNNLKDSYIE